MTFCVHMQYIIMFIFELFNFILYNNIKLYNNLNIINKFELFSRLFFKIGKMIKKLIVELAD